MFSVRCQSGVHGPRVRSYGDGFGTGEHCGRLGRLRFLGPFRPLLIVWDPTPVGALTHKPSLDGNDPLLRHISRVYCCIGTSCGRWCSQDDYSHMVGSSDAKP